jgi:hypothetical protein
VNHFALLKQVGRVLVAYGKGSIVVGDEDYGRVVFPFLRGTHLCWTSRVYQPALRLRRTDDDLSDLLRLQAKRRAWDRVTLNGVYWLHSMTGAHRKYEQKNPKPTDNCPQFIFA